jgi:hypothetical protein
MVANLLWADDDCEEFLDPLGRTLKRNGFLVNKATSYTDGIQVLTTNKIHSVLVDIILPHAHGTGALGYDLGLVLAKKAVGLGVGAVTFLTVVPQGEVQTNYEKLRSEHPGIRFAYFDKTLLLEPNTIESVVQSLTPTKE